MDLRAGLALWLLCGLLLQPARAERPPGPHLDETPIAGETSGTPPARFPGPQPPLPGAAPGVPVCPVSPAGPQPRWLRAGSPSPANRPRLRLRRVLWFLRRFLVGLGARCRPGRGSGPAALGPRVAGPKIIRVCFRNGRCAGAWMLARVFGRFAPRPRCFKDVLRWARAPAGCVSPAWLSPAWLSCSRASALREEAAKPGRSCSAVPRFPPRCPKAAERAGSPGRPGTPRCPPPRTRTRSRAAAVGSAVCCVLVAAPEVRAAKTRGTESLSVALL